MVTYAFTCRGNDFAYSSWFTPLGVNAFTLGRKCFHPWAQTLSPLGVNQQLPRKNVKSAEKNDKSSEKTIATAGRNESVSRGEEDEDCVVQFYYR